MCKFILPLLFMFKKASAERREKQDTRAVRYDFRTDQSCDGSGPCRLSEFIRV